MKNENRRALRVALNVPTVIEPIGQPVVELHENLARVYQRVEPANVKLGEKFPGVLRDLSTNGAFIAGEALPLLSRVTRERVGGKHDDERGWCCSLDGCDSGVWRW